MTHLDIGAHARELAGHVEQAAKITGKQGSGPRVFDIRAFFRNDLIRDRAVFHGECAAEAAADFRVFHFHKFKPLDRAQQTARLVLDAQLAQARAAIVIGAASRVARLDLQHAQNIGEEGDQFEGLARELFRPHREARIVGEQFGIMFGDHPAAGARGDDDIIIALEGLDHLQREFARGAPVTRIEGGLPAAGLGGHLDDTSRAFEQRRRSEADRGPDDIDKAGREQGNPEFRIRLGPGHSGNSALFHATNRAAPPVSLGCFGQDACHPASCHCCRHRFISGASTQKVGASGFSGPRGMRGVETVRFWPKCHRQWSVR